MQKYEQYKNVVKFSLKVFILCIQLGIWVYFWVTSYSNTILVPFRNRGNWLVVAVYGLLLFFFTNLYGGFRIGYYRREDMSLSGTIAVFLTNGITYLQTCLLGRAIMPAMPFVWMTIINVAAFFLWTYIASNIYERMYPPHHLLMIYGGKSMASKLIGKMSIRTEKYQIKEAVSADTDITSIMEKVVSYSAIILCDVPTITRNDLLKFCFENDIRAYTTPKIPDILIRSSEEITLFDTPLLLNRNNGLSLEQRFLKRAMDISISLAMLVLSTPFMLFVAIAIKLQDGGPIIFKQARATINGLEFNVYKFRSMIVDAEKDGTPQPTVDNDSRITPIGRFIRKTRLDELPQLWNILIGDMSIVGPRPERLEHVEKYTAEIPEFAYRLKVRAGLTGYAQVVGKYNTTAYDKLKMDLMYIAKYSLLMDIKIIFITLKILFIKESTEGMKDESVNTLIDLISEDERIKRDAADEANNEKCIDT